MSKTAIWVDWDQNGHLAASDSMHFSTASNKITLFVHVIWRSLFWNCFLGHISEWNPCFHTPKANVDKKSIFFVITFQVTSKFPLKKSLKFHWTYFFHGVWAPKFNYLYSGGKEARQDRKWKHNLAGINHCKYCWFNKHSFCRTKKLISQLTKSTQNLSQALKLVSAPRAWRKPQSEDLGKDLSDLIDTKSWELPAHYNKTLMLFSILFLLSLLVFDTFHVAFRGEHKRWVTDEWLLFGWQIQIIPCPGILRWWSHTILFSKDVVDLLIPVSVFDLLPHDFIK